MWAANIIFPCGDILADGTPDVHWSDFSPLSEGGYALQIAQWEIKSTDVNNGSLS
jgi:hypothetical protein